MARVAKEREVLCKRPGSVRSGNKGSHHLYAWTVLSTGRPRTQRSWALPTAIKRAPQ